MSETIDCGECGNALDLHGDVADLDAQLLQHWAKHHPNDATRARLSAGDLDGIAANLISAAAGADTHPGGEQLKHYWIYGEGRAKWSTWTELYHHLLKYLEPEKAKRTAADWFHERFGFWPGADLNRVRQGKSPRGKVVGKG